VHIGSGSSPSRTRGSNLCFPAADDDLVAVVRQQVFDLSGGAMTDRRPPITGTRSPASWCDGWVVHVDRAGGPGGELNSEIP